MAEILNLYSSLSPSSPRSHVSDVLKAIIEASGGIDPSNRKELISSILKDIEASESDGQNTLSPKDVAQALTAVKFLGKDVSGSECISSPKNLSTLLELAFKEDQEVSNEALRCIANALLLVEQTRDIFTQKEVDGGIITASLLEKSSTPDQIFLLSRILLLNLAAGTSFVRTLVEEGHNGRTIVQIIDEKLDKLSSSILTSEKMASQAMSELLKVATALLLRYPRIVGSEHEHMEVVVGGNFGGLWSPTLNGLLAPLLRTFFSLPPTSPSPVAPPLTYVIHCLISIPVSPTLRPVWLSSDPQAPNILHHALDLLDAAFAHYLPGSIDLNDPTTEEITKTLLAQENFGDVTLCDLLSPLVIFVTQLSSYDEASREYVRQRIVPDDLDRTTPLDERPDLLGRSLQLLGSLNHSTLKAAVGELLFAMADSSPAVLCDLVGYGHVAGFLHDKGVLAAPTGSSNVRRVIPPGASIDPVTGMIASKPELPDLTDQEKDQEMEKLFVLFNRLEKTGAVLPDQNPMRKVFQEAASRGS